VALVLCTGLGGKGSEIWDYQCLISQLTLMVGGEGGPGLEVWLSNVVVYDCSFAGGEAGSGGYTNNPGEGVRATNANVLIVNGAATGGDGGYSYEVLQGGSGAAGIFGGNCGLSILDCEFLGGEGYSGGHAQPTEIDPPATVWPGLGKSLGFFKLLREGQTTPLQVSGEPGELVLLMASTRTWAFQLNKHKGDFLLDPLQMLGPFAIGVIVQSPLTITVGMPQLPASVPALELYLQGLVQGPGPGGTTLTSWGHLTLLDSSY
jgi:hypothetical protein